MKSITRFWIVASAIATVGITSVGTYSDTHHYDETYQVSDWCYGAKAAFLKEAHPQECAKHFADERSRFVIFAWVPGLIFAGVVVLALWLIGYLIAFTYRWIMGRDR